MQKSVFIARSNAGFTLVEVSIVLLVIGLIIGGVFVGQELIRAAEIRSQVRQLENFSTAANTFRLKYGGMPGDLQADTAAELGFAARNGNNNDGNGNGLIESCYMGPPFFAPAGMGCEMLLFFADLSDAGLVEGEFAPHDFSVAMFSGTYLGTPAYFPHAKINDRNYILAGSCNSDNYFAIVYPHVVALNSIEGGSMVSNLDAFTLDIKFDDGVPTTGVVQYKASYAPVVSGQHSLCNAASTVFVIPPVLEVSCVTPAGEYNIANDYVGLRQCHLIVRFNSL